MGRCSASSGDDNNNDDNAINSSGGFHSIRDRFRFKRNSHKPAPPLPSPTLSPDRQWKTAARSHHHHHHHYNRSYSRKLIFYCFKERSWLYLCIFLVIFVFALASMVLQSSIMSVLKQGNERARWRWSVRDDLKLGSSLEFVQQRSFQLRNGLDLLRNQPRIGVRPPRIALVRNSILPCVYV